jgi:hypothetical protein
MLLMATCKFYYAIPNLLLIFLVADFSLISLVLLAVIVLSPTPR